MSARSYLDLAVQRTFGILTNEKDVFATLGAKDETARQQLQPAVDSPQDDMSAEDWGEVELEERLSTRETTFSDPIPHPDRVTRNEPPSSEMRFNANSKETTESRRSPEQTDKITVSGESDRRRVSITGYEAPILPQYSMREPENKAPVSVEQISYQPPSPTDSSIDDRPSVQTTTRQRQEPFMSGATVEQQPVALAPNPVAERVALTGTSPPATDVSEQSLSRPGVTAPGQPSHSEVHRMRSESISDTGHVPFQGTKRPTEIEHERRRDSRAMLEEAEGAVEIRPKVHKRQGEPKGITELEPRPRPTTQTHHRQSEGAHSHGSAPQTSEKPRLTIGRIEVYVTPPEVQRKVAKPKGPSPSLSRSPYSTIGLGQT